MSEIVIFILGALFCLGLMATIVLLLPPPGMMPLVSPSTPVTQNRGRPAQSEPARPSAAPRLLNRPTCSARDDRDTDRTRNALDRAEGALRQIVAFGEPAAAKIARHALNRLSGSGAPARARLTFARGRLELLALRQEPRSSAVARSVLSGLT